MQKATVTNVDHLGKHCLMAGERGRQQHALEGVENRFGLSRNRARPRECTVLTKSARD